MKQRPKKLLSILLALALVLGMLPALGVTALADGDTSSFTITFKSASGDSDGQGAISTKDDIISGGANYISSLNATRIYNGKSGNGIKFGSSSNPGSLTLNFVESKYVTSIVVNAMQYNNDSSAVVGIQDDDYSNSPTTSFANYTYSYSTPTLLSSITLFSGNSGSNKRLYVKSVTVNCGTPHFHDFTYAATGATITATCGAANCGLTDKKATLTIDAPALKTEGGSESPAAVLPDLFNFTAATGMSIAETDIKYAGIGSTNYSESAIPPTAAGTYTASITLTDVKTGADPTGSVTASVDYAIHAHSFNYYAVDNDTITAVCSKADCPSGYDKTPPTLTIAAPTDLAYDGTEKAVTVTNNIPGLADPTVTYTKDGSSFAGTPKEAGAYTASVTVAGQTASVAFEITDLAYSVNIASGTEYGTVTADKETAKFGETVTLTATPDEGYGLVSLTVTDANSNTVTVIDNKFSMPSSPVTVTATYGALKTYTVYYKPSGSPETVSFNFAVSGDGDPMKRYQLDDDNVFWIAQLVSPDGITSINVAFKENGGEWGALDARKVYTDPAAALTALTAGGDAVIVKGTDNVFTVSFSWGDVDDDGKPETAKKAQFFVTAGTTSVTVENPTKEGYDFVGWEYSVKASGDTEEIKTVPAASGNTTIVPIKANNITESTLFLALWRHSNPSIDYELNGGSVSGAPTSVEYGSAIGELPTPTKSGYAFVGWTVARNVTELVGDKEEMTLLAGSAFDASTKIINDLTLQAAWKHVHSYAYLTFASALRYGLVTEAYAEKYGPYLHIKICTSGDDVKVEAHQFDTDGKCACGYAKPTEMVDFYQTFDGRDNTPIQSREAKGSSVSISAPSDYDDGTTAYEFQKWEYSLYNGASWTEWADLAGHPGISFKIPGNMKVNAVYTKTESEPRATLLLKTGHYKDDGILFQFSYLLPEGYTALSAMITAGDNKMLGYKKTVTDYEMGSDYGLSFIGENVGTAASIATMSSYEKQIDREDNALVKLGKRYLGTRMLNGEAISVPGKYNAAWYQSAQNLGQRNGYAYIPTSGIGSGPNGEELKPEFLNGHYFYVLGAVLCEDTDHNPFVVMVGPIAVTYSDCERYYTEEYTFKNGVPEEVLK